MSKSINCQFTPPKGSTANYENHRVIISYTKIIKNSEGQTTLRPISEPISLLPIGIFAVLVPEETEIENQNISITLKSPTGATLFNQTYQYNQLYPSVAPEGEEDKSGLFKIEEVAPQLPITLGDAGDVGSYKVKGKAILFEDGSPLANTSLFIWGAFAKKSESSNTSNKSKSVVAEDATSEPSVIQVVKTDIDGYFSFEIENRPLDQAYVQLAGQENTFPLTLDEQNFLKDHQIVVSEVTPDHQDDDCGCKQSVPTLPDAEDLVNSSVYSQDLGGTCIDFTTPNRSLEEFSYFHIVRTTEPEIRKTPYQKPPLLNPFLKGAETTTQSSNDTTSSEQQANQHSTKNKSSSSAKGGGTSWDGSGEDKFGNAWDKRYRAFLIQYLNSPEGRWWIFTQDITDLTYIQNNPPLLVSYQYQQDEYDAYAGNNYVTAWKQQLNNLYNYVYGDSPTTENELYDFLLFIHQEYINEYGKSPKLPPDLIQFVQSVFKQDSKGRVELDGRHAVDWDETPTLYHNTTIAHGHILNFKQIWKADGYSLGDLLYSLPLAPCQKKQIAIFDWDRTNTAQRDEFTTASEQMDAYLSRDRDISEVVNTALGESMDASSSANANSNSEVKSKSFNVGGSVGVQAGPWSASVSAGYSSGKTSQTADSASASEAFQNSARNLSASTMQNVQDNVMQGASAVRSQRSTVVETVGQSEQMNVQTEVITNHNHCHSLTIEYFEVLRHFAIEQKLVDVQECLFIPLEMTPFDMDKILRWKSEIANFLNDRYLLAGITALEKIKSQTRQQPTILADEPIRELMGKITLSLVINRPADVEIAGQKVMDDTKWNRLQGLLGPWTISRIRAAIEAKEEAEKEQLFREEILPEMFANFIDKLIFGYIDANGQDVPLNIEVFVTNEGNLGRLSNKHQSSKGKWQKMRQDMTNYDAGSPIMLQIRMLPGQNVRRSDIERFYIKSAFELPEGSQVEFVAGSALYRTNSLKENLFTQNPYETRDDLNDQVPLEFYTPLNERERYNPLLEAYEQANHLIEHLNEHLEFFHKAIWFQMSPDRRFMLLDGFIAPHSNGKSVASVVENRLMGVVGNNLVMPVARGFHLDPTFAQKTNDDNQATPPKPIDLLAHYQPTTPKSPFRVSVPTRGVYAEAVQGACNSCEKIDESRHWRFTEVPCGDEPTAIQPISTDSRYVDPGNLQAKDLPPNIVNFQNVPAAPNPTGLNAALNVLSNPDLFRDITGLDANQANAISALLATQKGALDAFNTSSNTAKEFAKMATDMAKLNDANRKNQTDLDTIDKLESEGKIDKEYAKKARKDVLERKTYINQSPHDVEGGAQFASYEEEEEDIQPPCPRLNAHEGFSSGDGDISTGKLSTTIYFVLDTDVGEGEDEATRTTLLNDYIAAFKSSVEIVWNNFSFQGQNLDLTDVEFLALDNTIDPTNRKHNLFIVGAGTNDVNADDNIDPPVSYVSDPGGFPGAISTQVIPGYFTDTPPENISDMRWGYMYYNNGTNINYAAHEFGHIFGLTDRYHEGCVFADSSKPNILPGMRKTDSRITTPMWLPEKVDRFASSTSRYCPSTNLYSRNSAGTNPTVTDKQLDIVFDMNKNEEGYPTFVILYRTYKNKSTIRENIELMDAYTSNRPKAKYLPQGQSCRPNNYKDSIEDFIYIGSQGDEPTICATNPKVDRTFIQNLNSGRVRLGLSEAQQEDIAEQINEHIKSFL